MNKTTFMWKLAKAFSELDILEEEFRKISGYGGAIEEVLGKPLGLSTLREPYEEAMLKIAVKLDNQMEDDLK